jgi:hypothetical protein
MTNCLSMVPLDCGQPQLQKFRRLQKGCKMKIQIIQVPYDCGCKDTRQGLARGHSESKIDYF